MTIEMVYEYCKKYHSGTQMKEVLGEKTAFYAKLDVILCKKLAKECYDKNTQGMLQPQTFALAVSSAWNGFSHIHKTLLCLFFGSLLKCLLLCESFSNYSVFNSNKFYTIPPSYTHSFHHPFYFIFITALIIIQCTMYIIPLLQLTPNWKVIT